MNLRHRRGADHPLFTGRTVTVRGYVRVRCDGHPRADVNGFVLEHILVAERALGRHLEARHPVHHANGNRQDNRPGNLVLCEDNAYHKLLHKRMAAKAACGNPNWVKCSYCQQWDAPKNMGKDRQHPACRNAYVRNRRREIAE